MHANTFLIRVYSRPFTVVLFSVWSRLSCAVISVEMLFRNSAIPRRLPKGVMLAKGREHNRQTGLPELRYAVS
jgi:hypothetical protein